MIDIPRLIRERFETVLQDMYPQLKHIDDKEKPYFEHKLFYAETKIIYDDKRYTVHLKKYQIKAFKKLEKKKPVIYLIGVHNFEKSIGRLVSLNLDQVRDKLSREMDILRFFIVDSSTIANIWDKRIIRKKNNNYCKMGENNLHQIIENRQIRVYRERYNNAREYYSIPSDKYSFSMPELNKGLKIGHIMPLRLNNILEYFYI